MSEHGKLFVRRGCFRYGGATGNARSPVVERLLANRTARFLSDGAPVPVPRVSRWQTDGFETHGVDAVEPATLVDEDADEIVLLRLIEVFDAVGLTAKLV